MTTVHENEEGEGKRVETEIKGEQPKSRDYDDLIVE